MTNRPLLSLLVIITFAACGIDTGRGPETIVRDSAGIHIVESNTPVWDGTDRWHLAPEPILHLGDETKPAEQFVRIVNAFRLRGGTIVVVNFNNPPDLRFFSETGEHLTTVGGSGGGSITTDTWTPACDSIVTSMSILNRSMFPRTRSLTRGWVTPNNSAASRCFSPRDSMTCSTWIINSERIFRLSASSAGKPRSLNTFPVESSILVGIWAPSVSRPPVTV